jgi:hypothetical protein
LQRLRFFNAELGLLRNAIINERLWTQARAAFFKAFININIGWWDSIIATAAQGEISSTLDTTILQFTLKVAR